MDLEQIKLIRRFVSDFMYKTDATFNTNVLRLPLSVMVGIANTGKTFPAVYCYITAESAASFKWIVEQLTDLCFYNCLEPAVICGDFSKGLRAAVVAKAVADLAVLEPTNEVPLVSNTGDMPEAREVVVLEETSKPACILLQLCEWHAMQAIQRKLVSVGRYNKEEREELTNSIQAQIQTNIEKLDDFRTKLAEALFEDEAEYLDNYYYEKEEQFCRAYTRTYRKLRVYTTQRNKLYYVVVKVKLHKHLPVSKAIHIIVEQTKLLGCIHNDEVNLNQRMLLIVTSLYNPYFLITTIKRAFKVIRI